MTRRKELKFSEMLEGKEYVIRTGKKQFKISREGIAYFKKLPHFYGPGRAVINRKDGGEPLPVLKFTSIIRDDRQESEIGMLWPEIGRDYIQVGQVMNFELVQVIRVQDSGNLFLVQTYESKNGQSIIAIATLNLGRMLKGSPFYYDRKSVTSISA